MVLMTNTTKIFILGLPRTATTSACVAMLELGFNVAHTCYTTSCLTQADVIADTPIFSEYEKLDKQFAHCKFIYLKRDLKTWLPSIKQLLLRMHKNINRSDGGFNPIIKQCYSKVFCPFTLDNIKNDEFLTQCYEKHQQQIVAYFKDRPADLLSIDIAAPCSYQQLTDFIGIKNVKGRGFQKINIGGKVTAWKDIKHPNKIESTRKGRIDKNLLS